MPTFAHVIEAPPERVWDALASVNGRTRHHTFFVEAESGKGKAGTKGSEAVYKTKLFGGWRERLAETDRPGRIVFEELPAADGDEPTAELDWRLEPVNLGTQVVLHVRGKGFLQWFLVRFVKKYRYRALVRAVKRSIEGIPKSIVDDFPTMDELEARRAAEAGEEAAEKAAEPEEKKGRMRLGLKKGKGADAGGAAPEAAEGAQGDRPASKKSGGSGTRASKKAPSKKAAKSKSGRK